MRIDRLPADVLVVHPQPWPCWSALSAIERREVKVVLTLDGLDSIGSALAAAAAGCAVCSDAVLAAASELDGVSSRSLERLGELALGASNVDIATRLHVSVPTVKREVTRLQRKLGARDRVGLLACAHKLGFALAR